MTVPRLFVSNSLGEAGAEIALSAAQSHYLLNVLRLSEGSEILAFDGKNGEWRAEIVNARKACCCIRPKLKVREQTAPQDIHYAFAPLKHARLDYMVQKAAEMGASLLQPVITAHTAVSRLNSERMRANAIEAAEQCGILAVPSINPTVKLESLLKACEGSRVIVFCDERAEKAPPLEILGKLKGRKVTALVGPEGGFSESERELLLSKSNVCAVSLGPRIMRADTAAVAILALVNAVLGDWR
ncbi:MAG: 16S rRNA (uracil(1498)-N(3))-methyltransferase [Rhodomicrobium sp.]